MSNSCDRNWRGSGASTDARIADLEKRLAAVTAGAGTAPAAPAATPPPPSPEPTTPAQAPEAPVVTTPPPSPEPTAPAPAPQAPLPPTETGSQPVSSSKVFNPDIAVIGNVLGAAGTNHIEDSPGWQLNEAEASFQAVVDPYARGDFFIAVGPDGAEVEEGFVTFTSLPGGLLVKAGKMRGQFGKVNTMHTHALPWTDRPLVTRNLLGGDEGISDGGITVSKLIPNRLLFLEATGELFGGRSGVFTGSERSHLSYIGRVRGYRNLTEGTNLDLGASFAFGHTDLEPDSTRRLIGVDATFRYRPLRRAIYRRFLGRTELVWNQDRLESASPTRVRDVRERRVPVRAALVCRGPLRLLAAPAGLLPGGPGWRRNPDLLAERIQPGAGPVPAHSLRGARDGQRVPVPVPVLDWSAWGACFLTGGGSRCRVPGCQVGFRVPGSGLVPGFRLVPTWNPEPGTQPGTRNPTRGTAKSLFKSRCSVRRVLSALLVAGAIGAMPVHAHAAVKVVATTEDLAALAREVGGDKVSVEALARGYQDPHFVEAKPSFILKLHDAQLLVAVGRELEIGWLPPLISQSRNAAVQPGARGYLDASLNVRILDIPTGQVTRAMGDVHPQGNPHYWLDPTNGRRIAQALQQRLSELSPGDAAYFAAAVCRLRQAPRPRPRSAGTRRWRRTRARRS